MIRAPARRRRSLRLKDYDYAQAGAYFVTICAQDRTCLFGTVHGGAMRLSGAGEMIAAAWKSLPTRFPELEIDAFVVMPNHLHGVIVLSDANVASVGALVGALSPAPSLGSIVGAFKSATTVEYVNGVAAHSWPRFRCRLWQRNFYEHIIRDDADLTRIRHYIDENPARWEFDEENPDRRRDGPA